MENDLVERNELLERLGQRLSESERQLRAAQQRITEQVEGYAVCGKYKLTQYRNAILIRRG